MTTTAKPGRKLIYGSVGTWFLGLILCGAFSEPVPQIPLTYLVAWAAFFAGAFVVARRIPRPPPGIVWVVIVAPFLVLASSIIYWLNIFR